MKTDLRLTIPAAALACLALWAPAASAADRIYWGDLAANAIATAGIDGSSPTTLAVGGATMVSPNGTAIDMAGGRIFWPNGGDRRISFAKLDGSGGGDLEIRGASVENPVGIALDPVAGRLYWANTGNGTIATAKLDGSDARNLPLAGVSLSMVFGVAVDPVGRRIYWTNRGNNFISTARLDGSDARDLTISGEMPDMPSGIAVDPVAGRLYWANFGSNEIVATDLDGSNGGRVPILGASVAQPLGVAFDPVAGRLYWGNTAGRVRLASAPVGGGPGGANLVLGTATGSSGYPSLLLAPHAAAAPVVTGGSEPGATLSCSQGSWTPDAPGSFAYRAAQSYAFQWTRDGAAVPGATAATLVASAAGDYACSVQAGNLAGTTTAASAAHRVAARDGGTPTGAFGAKTKVTLKLAATRIPARGPVKVRVVNRNAFTVRVAVSATTITAIPGVRGGRVRLAAVKSRVAAGKSRTVALKLPARVRRVLAERGALRLAVKVVATDPSGHRRTVRARVTAKLARR